MSLTDLLRTAFRSVSANKLRAALTMLGVVIGVASVIAMLALGNGARAAVDATFASLGANQIQIGQRFSMQDGEFAPMGKTLTFADGLEMLSTIPLIERVEMSVSKTVKARFGKNTVEINVIGTTADAIDGIAASGEIQPVGWESGASFSTEDLLSDGRIFSTDEVYAGAPVCVLGYQTALDLFSGDDPIGETIWVDRTRCTVIGVITELESTDVQERYRSDPNEGLLMPISTVIQTLYEDEPSVYMTAHVTDASRIGEAKEQITNFLRERHQIEQDADGNKLGVLEFSNGPSYGADVINAVTNAWLVASLFAIVIAALTGWFISKRVTSPVLALEHATRQMESGDLSVRVNLQNEKQQEFLSLANSFNGMAEQIEQTVSTLRAFVADAAHELHTPLTALQANIELARDEENASARTRYLSRAQEQGQRLEALVKSLLDLSRIEAADADAKSEFVTVDLIQLVKEIGEQFASRAEQTDRSFTMNIPDDAVSVLGNETQLRQVVINLLENALKFTPADGQIILNLEQTDNEIRLKVSDSGIGIPPEDLPHLFERFHRGRNVSEFTGNGLGLAIVKAIVQSHSGKVEAQSPGLGEGSVFIMNLPLD